MSGIGDFMRPTPKIGKDYKKSLVGKTEPILRINSLNPCEKESPPGFYNPGTRCNISHNLFLGYLNAALQCVCITPGLKEAIDKSRSFHLNL